MAMDVTQESSGFTVRFCFNRKSSSHLGANATRNHQDDKHTCGKALVGTTCRVRGGAALQRERIDTQRASFCEKARRSPRRPPEGATTRTARTTPRGSCVRIIDMRAPPKGMPRWCGRRSTSRPCRLCWRRFSAIVFGAAWRPPHAAISPSGRGMLPERKPPTRGSARCSGFPAGHCGVVGFGARGRRVVTRKSAGRAPPEVRGTVPGRVQLSATELDPPRSVVIVFDIPLGARGGPESARWLQVSRRPPGPRSATKVHKACVFGSGEGPTDTHTCYISGVLGHVTCAQAWSGRPIISCASQGDVVMSSSWAR